MADYQTFSRNLLAARGDAPARPCTPVPSASARSTLATHLAGQRDATELWLRRPADRSQGDLLLAHEDTRQYSSRIVESEMTHAHVLDNLPLDTAEGRQKAEAVIRGTLNSTQPTSPRVTQAAFLADLRRRRQAGTPAATAEYNSLLDFVHGGHREMSGDHALRAERGEALIALKRENFPLKHAEALRVFTRSAYQKANIPGGERPFAVGGPSRPAGSDTSLI